MSNTYSEHQLHKFRHDYFKHLSKINSKDTLDATTYQKLKDLGIRKPPRVTKAGKKHKKREDTNKEKKHESESKNIDYNKLDNPERIEFADLIDTFGLKQLVHEQTHTSLHTLDFVITRSEDQILRSVHVSDTSQTTA